MRRCSLGISLKPAGERQQRSDVEKQKRLPPGGLCDESYGSSLTLANTRYEIVHKDAIIVVSNVAKYE